MGELRFVALALSLFVSAGQAFSENRESSAVKSQECKIQGFGSRSGSGISVSSGRALVPEPEFAGDPRGGLLLAQAKPQASRPAAPQAKPAAPAAAAPQAKPQAGPVTAAAKPQDKAPEPAAAAAKPMDPAFEQAQNAGIALFNKSKYEEALPHFQKALELDPNNVMVRSWMTATYGQMNKWQDAARIGEEIVELDPGYSEGWNNLGMAYQQLEDFEKAESSYKKALELKPGFLEGHYNLAFVLMKSKKLEDATKEYETVLKMDPNYVDAYVYLADMALKMKNYDKCIEYCTRTLEKDKKNAGALCKLALCDKAKGDRTKAKEGFEKVLDLNPQFYEALLGLGSMAMEDKDYSGAIQYLAKALEANPYDAGAHYWLGRYYYGLDSLKNSIKQFTDAEKCDTDGEYADLKEWKEKAVEKQKTF